MDLINQESDPSMNRACHSLLILVFLTACVKHEKKQPTVFYFTNNYEKDSKAKHIKGLLWTLSYLGAEMRKGALDSCIIWKDSLSFSLDYKKAGFDSSVINSLEKIEYAIDTGMYYKKFGKADFGQFVALTIGVSAHYYKITKAPGTYAQMLESHNTNDLKVFPVTRSTVAKGHRRILFSVADPDPTKWIFIAEEGEGSLEDSTFVPSFYEVMDILPNGQLRCAIYNSAGSLVEASPLELGAAGKPAKCLWCHELVIQPLFETNIDLAGQMTTQQFHDELRVIMKRLTDYRSDLKGEVDFTATQDHTFMELEYIPYMQPSLKKLAKQWNMKESEVSSLVKGLTFLPHEEFGMLGPLIQRDKVNKYRELFPYSIREPGSSEINLFKTTE